MSKLAKVAIISLLGEQANRIEHQLRGVVYAGLERALVFKRFDPGDEKSAMEWLDDEGLVIFGSGTTFAEANDFAKAHLRSPRLQAMLVADAQLELTGHPITVPAVAVTGELLFHALRKTLLA